MKRAAVESDPPGRIASRGAGDWSVIRVKLRRSERKSFEEIALRSGASTNAVLHTLIRRTIETGEHPFKVTGFRTAPETSTASEKLVHGVSISRLSKIGANVAQAAHMRHIASDQILPTFMELLASDRLIRMASFRARAGLTKQALTRAETAQRVFHLEVQDVRPYPWFFLDARFDRKELGAVAKLMGKRLGGSKWEFFTTPKVSLAVPAKPGEDNGTARTPLQALLSGDFEAGQAISCRLLQR